MYQAPWVGAASEFRLFATGDNEGISFLSPGTVREEQRTYETNHWLLPAPPKGDKTSPWGNTVFVQTDVRNYTSSADDLTAFFKDIGYPIGNRVWPRVLGLVDPYQGPGVEVVCMYSHGVNTASFFKYAGGSSPSDFQKDPTTINSDGDGTVPVPSLGVCEGWKDTQAETVTVKKYAGINHAGMVMDAGVIDDIISIIQSK
jgi:lysophospholipase-3